MRKVTVLILFLVLAAFVPQKERAFDVGEFYKFKIHYGLVNAGFATLELKEAVVHNKKVFHAVGRGYTTGMTKFFFKVQDNYESYFDKETGNPYQYVRKINEGGYTKNQEGFFDWGSSNHVLVKDYKHKSNKTFIIPNNTQDLVSAFYYLRNYPSIDRLKVGESVSFYIFLDDEATKFKLKFIGRENLQTKFGTVPTMIFRPFVQAGRIFKEQESVTVWISDDDNKIPLRIKASLAVGSLKADLEEFRGLKHPFAKK